MSACDEGGNSLAYSDCRVSHCGLWSGLCVSSSLDQRATGEYDPLACVTHQAPWNRFRLLQSRDLTDPLAMPWACTSTVNLITLAALNFGGLGDENLW